MIDIADPAIVTGRSASLFADDWERLRGEIRRVVAGASVLVIGGAGTIGAAAVRMLAELEPARLHVIDTDENGLARLAREVRAAPAQRAMPEMFFLAADFGAHPAALHVASNGPFDIVLNFAAIKHVRSEKSLPALLHLISTNIVKQHRFLRTLETATPPARYFAVSTDKAADPANFMGASKRVLEEVIFAGGDRTAGMAVSSARFANVAFSSGSLLESFIYRLQTLRPLAAPRETLRFFISDREAAEICLLALVSCKTGQVLVPRLKEHDLVDLAAAAAAFLQRAGYRPRFVETLEEANRILDDRPAPGGDYPVILTPRDTTGEKPFEIFASTDETIIEAGLAALVAVAPRRANAAALERVLDELALRTDGVIATDSPQAIADLIRTVVPNFAHAGGTSQLDDRI
jgi:FlaA1/EpsC-like NDP-sugar epimerase